ncbi:hypothetical protein UlMin_020313 [Ulmus minor]
MVACSNLLSNKIERDQLEAGDHIYSWRGGYLYAHHGIYIGEGKVIHFNRGADPKKIGTRTGELAPLPLLTQMKMFFTVLLTSLRRGLARMTCSRTTVSTLPYIARRG